MKHKDIILKLRKKSNQICKAFKSYNTIQINSESINYI